MARGLRLVRSDFDIVEEMIKTGEIFEDFTYVEAINRIFKWYMGEENLSFEHAIKATEDWLKENGVEFTHEAVIDKCKWHLDKKGQLKQKLIQVDKVEIYENEIEMINSLPNADLKRAYFTMMIYCKLRKQRELEPYNKLINGYNEFLSYCDGQISVKREVESINWLFQNGYIDVPLDDLNGYYYTGVEPSGKVVYEIDGTKLGRNDLKQAYLELFGEKSKRVMIIDLKKESGYDAIKDTRKDVVNYLKEQGAKTDSSNTRKIIVHEKYMAGDYTLVEVQMENELWIRGAEILQRSLQPCSRKVFKTIPQHIMREIFTCDSMNIELQEKRHGKAPNIKWCVSKRDDKQSLASKLRR
jgi:transcription antitermination factor NusG